MALAALTFTRLPALRSRGTAQFGDRHCLVELGDGGEDLPDEFRCGGVVQDRLRAICCDQLDAESLQFGEADLLDHQIPL